jgi:hypothetical protein
VLPFVGRWDTVADRPLVIATAMSCAPAELPTHTWYETVPVPAVQLNVTVLLLNVDPFAGLVIAAWVMVAAV